jgi:hypothetical protein
VLTAFLALQVPPPRSKKIVKTELELGEARREAGAMQQMMSDPRIKF